MNMLTKPSANGDALRIMDGEPLPVRLDARVTGLGLDTKREIVYKFGFNGDTDTAGPEDLWPLDGFYSGFNATAAEICTVVSSSTDDDSAGTGARTIEIFGLDDSYEEISETIALNGTTAVDTANEYIRVHRAIVRTAGSGGENAGNITVAQKITTANVFVFLPIGFNQTQQAAYTVPAGKRAVLEMWSASINKSSSGRADVSLRARPDGEVFHAKDEFSISSTGTGIAERLFTNYPPIIFEPKTDIVLRATVSANNTKVYGLFILTLENQS